MLITASRSQYPWACSTSTLVGPRCPKGQFRVLRQEFRRLRPECSYLTTASRAYGRQGRRNAPIRARDDAIFVPSLHHSSSTAWLAATVGLNPSAKLHQGVIRRELGFQSLVARCNIDPPRAGPCALRCGGGVTFPCLLLLCFTKHLLRGKACPQAPSDRRLLSISRQAKALAWGSALRYGRARLYYPRRPCQSCLSSLECRCWILLDLRWGIALSLVLVRPTLPSFNSQISGRNLRSTSNEASNF